LTPLILWTDKRAAQSEALEQLIQKDDFLYSTGLGIYPGKHAMISKIDWIQHHQTQIWNKTKRILSISDYFVFAVTGEPVSDFSTASMTGLLNIVQNNWWKDALELFNIDVNQLSTPQSMGSFSGKLSSTGAKLTGLKPHTALYSGGLDHHMVAVGAGIPFFHQISESTGTVLACVNYKQTYLPEFGVNIAKGLSEGSYFQMAFDLNGAVVLDWFQKTYAQHLSIQELIDRAKTIEPGCSGLIAKPYADKYEGLDGFINIDLNMLPAHFARAILESTSLSMAQLINQLDSEHKVEKIIPSGGGARNKVWLQIKANILNKPFAVPDSGELACKGAALLCAVGEGVYTDYHEAIGHQCTVKEMIFPEKKEVIAYKKWHQTIKNKIIWVN